ncbi:unnamed protein product [Rotaria socialis]
MQRSSVSCISSKSNRKLMSSYNGTCHTKIKYHREIPNQKVAIEIFILYNSHTYQQHNKRTLLADLRPMASGGKLPFPPTTRHNSNGHQVSAATPSMDNSTLFLMKISRRAPTNAPILNRNQNDPHISTIIFNTRHSPYIVEELPPPYDALGDIKKNPTNTSVNMNEQFPLTILPDTTLTNTNERTTTAAALILPTAPSPPPPSYSNFDESNK